MSEVDVLGAGAFGAALASVLSRSGRQVCLWARDPQTTAAITDLREAPRLKGHPLPETLRATSQMSDCTAHTALLCVPMQQLSGFLAAHAEALTGRNLVACCKGIDLDSGQGPSSLIEQQVPGATAAVLTGPSFAADLARGLPTALTLACRDTKAGEELQNLLSGGALRVYRTTDTTGAELGGALKNVIALAAGMVIGAGLGDSARAALIARGFAEMRRLAAELGADPDTLTGLSGLGDVILTCTSSQSRNFAHGHKVASGGGFEPDGTVEGIATARAVVSVARARKIDMPVCAMVAAVLDQTITVEEASAVLLSRDLKEE